MSRAYRLIVFCVVSFGGAAVGNTAIGNTARAQTSGPVASYALSEGTGTTAADTSGNGNAGTLTAPSSWTSGGRFGNGLLLEGDSQGITVPASPALDVASGLTLEAWICPASIAGYPKIIWRDGDGGSPFNLGMAYGNGTLVFGVLTTSGSFSVAAYSSLNTNVWTHVAATYDGAALRIYIDGVVAGSVAASGVIVASTGDLWLGRAPWGEGFAGRYDEVRIYDRALTAVEIALDRDAQINGLDPPDVADRRPAPGATGVQPSGVLTATFSKAIDAATLTGSNFYLAGTSGKVPAMLAYDPATRVATLTPAAPLARLTSYTAHITTDVSDLDEGSLGSPVAWTFTTSPEPALAHAAYAFSEGTGGTTADSSANGNAATLTRPGLWSAGGKYGNGLLLGGAWDGARIPASGSLDVESSLTLETWVNPTSIADYPKLIWRDGLDGSPYSLGMVWGNGSIGFGITTTAGRFTVYTFRSILPDAWTHIAATYDGSMLRLYINGQLANASEGAGSIVASTGDLWLGRAPWGEGFAGTLDDVRIYGRALTASEIAVDMGTPATEVTPPAVVSTLPSSGQTSIDPEADIAATFDRPLAEGTVTASAFELRDSGNAVVAASVSYQSLTRTVVLDPTARLADAAIYTATLKTTITNSAGVALQNEYSWTFTTRDGTPPAITGVSPATGVPFVSLNSTVQVGFSEPLDANSVTAAAIQLLDTRNVPVPGALTYDGQTITVTFTPAAALLPTRTYRVIVSGGASGVKDLAGNPLAASYTSTFITTVEPVRLAAGLNHSVAIDDTGQVWTWGGGSLQVGTSLDGRVPAMVTGAAGIVSVAAGASHTLALKADGTLLVWGDNSRGQLGTNSTQSSPTPTALGGLTNVIAVAGGNISSMALRSDGTVWTWGFWHQLGGGQTVDSSVPVKVPGLSSVIAIASSDYADYALKTDGTVWAWGENTFGQIGDGTNGGGLLRPTPVQVSLLSGVVGIAGGDNHAFAVVGSDLSVRAWGSNNAGQLGTGSNNPDLRNAPVAVIGLTDVRHIDGGGLRSVAALLDGTVKTWGSAVTSTGGDSQTPIPVPGNPAGVQVASGLGHGLAVSNAGTVWTWGTNNLGQLGDGTLTNRPTAAAIGDDAYAWKVGRPEFTRASGIYGAAFTVTVTSATPGATIRYTTNGADPTDSDAIVPANPIAINQSQTLKAKAWKEGSPPSEVTSAIYTLQVPSPSFSPGAGTYTSPPTVTIAGAPGATIRYTVDGTDPTPLSPAYAAPMTVDTFTVLKAKAFREGWTPSATATAAFTLNYGTLTPPVALPPGGTYASAQVVVLEAAGGAQIRYTLDGTDPDGGSTPYVAPLQLANGALTLKARAFKVDWTASAAITEEYTINEDSLPPVITASRAPEANLAGWNNTDVTVTFHCADASGVAVCTAPIRVSGEGYGLPVTGSATDTWGNHASATWNVNIDRTPPAVHVYVPRQSWNFPSSTTSVTIRGGAAELSGLESVSCDGVEATVTGNLFVCSVVVSAGANNVTIRASDIAGNNASTVISFSVGDTDVAALEISPGTMTMFAGDSREIAVTDERGNEMHQGVWSVLDPSIADVSESDGSTMVTALAAGQTTLSVAFQGHTAYATVSVVAAGGTWPAGSFLWSLNNAPGLGVPKRGEVLRATWSTADPDASRAPALLFVDEGTEWQANSLVRFDGHATRIRTTTADGRQLSDVRFAGRMPQQIAADNDGGFIVVLPARDGLPAAIQRFDSRSGSLTWEYIVTSGYLSDVAIHPDGMLYAAEGHVVGINYLVAITPAGLVHRSPLPHGHYKQIDTGSCGLDSAADTPGYLTGPIILEDGSVVLVSTVKVAEQIVYSYPEETAFNGCAVQSRPQDYSFTETSQVVQVSSSGPLGIHVLDDSARRMVSQFFPDEWRLMPDGHGGLLLGRRSRPSAIRISPDYHVVASNSTILPEDGSTRYETEYVLSEDGAYALVNSVRVISQRPFAYAYESKVVQFDTATLQRISNSNLGVSTTQPQHIRLKFALAGGGVYAVGPSTAYVVNPTVDTAGFAVGGNATHVANGLWSGWGGTGGPWAAPGTEPTIAQNRWAFAAGSENANAPSPRLLTTTRLRELAAERGIGAGLTGIQLNREIGLAFQGTAIWSMYQREDSNTMPLQSPIRLNATLGAVSTVIPDFLGTYQIGTTRPSPLIFPDSVLTEVKAVAGLIRSSHSRHQISGLIDAAKLSPLGVTNTNWPMVEFITTADTLLAFDVTEQATARHVEIRQRIVLELAGGFLQVGPGRSLNGSFWSMFVTGRTAVPGALPGRAFARLGTHRGESPPNDPDPPQLEP